MAYAKPAIFLFLILVAPGILAAEDWTTVDGRTFKNVTVVAHDDGYVTIMDDDGGGRIMLSELPPDLRIRFDFDPAKAMACVAATEKAEAQEQAAENEAKQKAAARPPTPDYPTSVVYAAPPDRTKTPAPEPLQPPEDVMAPDASIDTALRGTSGAAMPTSGPALQKYLSDEIKSLQDKVTFMQEQESSVTNRGSGSEIYVDNYGHSHEMTHGGYPEMIQQDQEKIQALQEQLNHSLAGG